MQLDVPAFWSAVAAVGAALCSFMILQIQRRNLEELVRPEIALNDWSRSKNTDGSKTQDVLTFESVKNVGKGVAVNVVVTTSQNNRKRPGTACYVPILAANENADQHGSIFISWENAEVTNHGIKLLWLRIYISYMDTRGKRYETVYEFDIDEDAYRPRSSISIAPGVRIRSRETKRRSWWHALIEGQLRW